VPTASAVIAKVSMSEPKLFTSPQGWTDLFMLVCFVMTAVCLYGGLKKALRKSSPAARTRGVLKELLVFGFFVFMFWSLESYAHSRAPYYAYATNFRDSLPRAHYFDGWIAHLGKPFCDRCTDIVNDFVKKTGGTIPLSVVLLEASLTYAALWTARLLRGPLGAQPIFAGLVLVTVDALLDPIVAMAHSCEKGLETAGITPAPPIGNGIGLWHWYLPIKQDLIYACPPVEPYQICHPDKVSGLNTLAPYFHIPVFNYAAWLGAPIILVALVNLVGPLRRQWIWPLVRRLLGKETNADPDLTWAQIALLLSVLGGLVAVIFLAPAQDPSVSWQYLVMAGALGLVLSIFIVNFGSFHTKPRVDATLVLPVALSLAVPAAVGLATGQFVKRPLLMPVAVIALAVGLWLACLPYRKALEKIAVLVGDVDRFTRVHYFGFTTLLVLLGASCFEDDPSSLTLLGLLLVAACFHVFAYASNDVFDLKVDKNNPLRRNDPLVSGKISVPTAMAIALGAIPISILITLMLVNFRPAPSALCLAVLGSAYALMTVYNLNGKTLVIPRAPAPSGQSRALRVPLVTDAVQGLAWALLAVFGALVAFANKIPREIPEATWEYPSVALGELLERCWILAAYGGLFIFLINGIHGGLRDLRSDQLAGRHTTAMVLGATADPNDKSHVLSTTRIQVFAHAVHIAMFGLVGAFLGLAPGELKSFGWSTACAVAMFGISTAILHGVVAKRSPKRNDWVSWGVFALLIPPIGMFWLREPAVSAFKVAVTASFFVPLLFQQSHLERLISWVYEDEGIKGRCKQGLNALWPKRKSAPVPAAALAGDVAGVSVDPDPDE
jgi:4-hydroxybenzoate polyprenyltransferase